VKRRAFIAGLGSMAAWPVLAQQEKAWRVGYLTPSSAANKGGVAMFDAFRLKHETMVKEAINAANVLGMTIVPVMAQTPADLDDAFTTIHNENCDALVVLADARVDRKIVDLADKWRLPAIYHYNVFVGMGGLLGMALILLNSFG